jgi:hypothetical protein
MGLQGILDIYYKIRPDAIWTSWTLIHFIIVYKIVPGIIVYKIVPGIIVYKIVPSITVYLTTLSAIL